METSGKLFVERIESLLKERGSTKAALSRDLNIHINNLTGWKTRNNLPSADVAGLIAEYLDTTVEFLLYGTAPELSFNTKKLLNDFLSLSDKDQIEVANIIAMKKAMQIAEEKKVSKLITWKKQTDHR